MNKMTADEIRAQIQLVCRGDLRGVPAALASTFARTEQARNDLQRAIEARKMPAADPSLTIDGIKKAARARWEAKRLARVEGPLREAYDRCGYRVAGSSWAGGEHDLTVSLVDRGQRVAASSSTARAWSKNGKWSGTNSSHAIAVHETWTAIDPSARVVAKLLTLEMGSVPVEPGIFQATWVEQGRGTSIAAHRGFLVDCGTSASARWMHAETVAGARRAIKAAQSPAKQPVDLKALDADGLLRRAKCSGHEVVTIDTAPVEGRICAAGIRDWAARHGLLVRGTATTREIADLAVSSGDRLPEVLVVLRAAGIKARSVRREAIAA